MPEIPIIITLGKARKLRESLGVDLLKDSDPTPIISLLNNRELLGEVLFFFSGETEKETYLDGLGVDELSAGWDNLADAFVNFCPSPSRAAVRKAIEKQAEAMAKAATAIAASMESQEVDGAIDRAIDEIAKQAVGTLG